MSIIGLKDTEGNKIKFPQIITGEGVFDNPALAKAMAEQELRDNRRGEYDISVTELLNDVRHRELARRHEVFVTAGSMMSRAVGTQYHAWLAAVSNGSVNELSVGAVVQGIGYGGHVDAYYEAEKWICDHKTTTVFQYQHKLEETKRQVWDYQWLMELNRKPVERITIMFWLKDHSWSKSYHPDTNVPVVDVTVANLKSREADINKRISEYLATKDLLDSELPDCTNKWTNKQGEHLRCLYYCDHADICNRIEAAKQPEPVTVEFNWQGAMETTIALFPDEAVGSEWITTRCPDGLPTDRAAWVVLYQAARKEESNV